MLLRLSRIVALLAATLAFAVPSVPTNAEAHGFLLGPALLSGWGRGAWGGGGPGWGGGWGGGGWGNAGWGGGGWGGGGW